MLLLLLLRFLVIIIFCTLDGENLLQRKLRHVQCTKKSTRILVSPVPFAPLQIKFYQFCYIN